MLATDPCYASMRLDPCMSRERAWIVGVSIATADDLAQALPPSRAVSWARWYAHELPEPLVCALDEGRALLVLQRSRADAVDQAAPAALGLVDLIDLAGDEGEDEDELTSSEPEEQPLHEVEVLVVDARGEPRAGLVYELRLPDGRVETGRTGPDGVLRHRGLPQAGDCQLTFPELVPALAA